MHQTPDILMISAAFLIKNQRIVELQMLPNVWLVCLNVILSNFPFGFSVLDTHKINELTDILYLICI